MTERTMTITVQGLAAKEIFDSIGPDIRQICRQEKGDHERRKRGVNCTYGTQASSKGNRCWVGLNLWTGESIPTVSC